MSLSNFLEQHKKICLVVQCKTLEEKCQLMTWCNEVKPKDWRPSFFVRDFTDNLWMRLRTEENQLTSTSHDANPIKGDENHTFQEFCQKYVIQESVINDKYTLI